MEKNIFENAKFGDKFVTRDGRIAVFLGEWKYVIGKKPNIYKCWIDGEEETIEYDSTGLSYPCETRCELDNGVVEVWDTDIVSCYQEPINEEKLDELANGYSTNPENQQGIDAEEDMFNAYKAGYRKAMEE